MIRSHKGILGGTIVILLYSFVSQDDERGLFCLNEMNPNRHVVLVVWEADRVKSNPKTPNLGPIFFERYDHKG